jgi:hypothetical protein
MTSSILAWAIYGYKKGLVIFYIAHLVSALICFAILGHLYSISRTRRKMEIYAVLVGLILFLLLYKLPAYTGWIGLTFTMSSRVPQFKHLFTDKNIRGVSILAHLFFIVADIFTIIYSSYYAMWPLLISSATVMASSIFIIFMVAKKSLRAYN